MPEGTPVFPHEPIAVSYTHLLPYSPYLMDVFLVYGYSQDAAVRLYEEIMGLAGQRPSAPETYAPAGE